MINIIFIAVIKYTSSSDIKLYLCYIYITIMCGQYRSVCIRVPIYIINLCMYLRRYIQHNMNIARRDYQFCRYVLISKKL